MKKNFWGYRRRGMCCSVVQGIYRGAWLKGCRCVYRRLLVCIHRRCACVPSDGGSLIAASLIEHGMHLRKSVQLTVPFTSCWSGWHWHAVGISRCPEVWGHADICRVPIERMLNMRRQRMTERRLSHKCACLLRENLKRTWHWNCRQFLWCSKVGWVWSTRGSVLTLRYLRRQYTLSSDSLLNPRPIRVPFWTAGRN